ncbi:hypothetical protein BCV69DRAFT_4120 [Microstroma glucosiphilum]|uniref:Extracellular membrane protein CFEM domain-containing protein n=1 Tax=Pseudomicrostroma glucosiphilum TaxID=1684307 RepID=A0A316UE84_9BASI|nr:hypothetical protein BCV69DRAFT_4120 [Pseudomicrostroma glucosiphilum]PWN23587.1 hypothetical protein BCV69DRAFT_4120 [Pseudomicrostroma glucosiphilum]
MAALGLGVVTLRCAVVLAQSYRPENTRAEMAAPVLSGGGFGCVPRCSSMLSAENTCIVMAASVLEWQLWECAGVCFNVAPRIRASDDCLGLGVATLEDTTAHLEASCSDYARRTVASVSEWLH